MVHRECSLEGLRRTRAAAGAHRPGSTMSAAALTPAISAPSDAVSAAAAAAAAAAAMPSGPQNGEKIILAYRHAEGYTNAVRRYDSKPHPCASLTSSIRFDTIRAYPTACVPVRVHVFCRSVWIDVAQAGAHVRLAVMGRGNATKDRA